MAEYKGLNIRFRGDMSDMSKALHMLSSDAKAAQGNLTGIGNALKSAKTNGEALNRQLGQLKLDTLSEQLRIAQDRLSAYTEAQPKLQSQLESTRARFEAQKATVEAMGDKYDALASGAKAAMAEVAEAQRDLSSARTWAEAAEDCDQYAAAQDRIADAQSRLDAAMAAGDAQFEETRTAFGTAQGALNSLEKQERSQSKALEENTRKMYESEAAAKAMAVKVRDASVAFDASQTGLSKFNESATEWSERAKKVGDSLTGIADKLTLVSTVAAATFGRSVISSAEDFGNAISQLGGYLNIHGQALDEMSDQALKWGKDTQFSATEAAQAMNELAKGGMTQAQISGGAMQATMELAAAGQLDMASAAEVAVQAIKTFGMEAGDASAIADALAGAANTSTAEVVDLANGFKYVGGWASMAGWNINDVSGALALLSDHGLQSEMAGTALRNVMQRLAAPTKKAAELMQSYGFSVRDSQGHMVNATEMVRRLNESFDSLTEEQRQKALNDIFGARALPAAIALMDEGADKLQQYIDATDNAGYATEMAKTRMGDLGWALEFLRGEAETASVNLGNALAPTITSVAKAVEGALEWFNSLTDAQREGIAQTALHVAAFAPFVSVLGHVASGVGTLAQAIGTTASVFGTFATALKTTSTVGEAFAATAGAMEMSTGALAGAMAGPIAVGAGVALAAIGALAAAIKEGIDHENEMAEATTGLTDAVANMEPTIQAAADSALSLADGMSMSADEVERSAEDLLDSQRKLTGSIKDTWDELGTNTGLIESYVRQIEELADKSQPTEAEQQKLRAAVDGFNSVAGTSIEVVDELTNKLSAQPAVIREIADAYKEYAKTQAVMESYADVQKQLVENAIEQQKYEALVEQGVKARAESQDGATGKTIEQIQAAEKAKVALQEAKEQEDSLNESVKALESMMGKGGKSADEYAKLLDDTGTAAKSTADTVADEADEAADAVATASDEAVTALKRANEDIETEAKRAADDALTNLRRELDAAYDARKTELDREKDQLSQALSDERDRLADAWAQERKEIEDANDKAYDLRKSELDREYKALSDSLSKERDAIKTANAKRVSELKAANDKAEKAYKATLDSRYKNLKSTLDAEAKAEAKANDKRLSELKAAQKKATEIYKDETKERLKQIDEEYKAQVKLLEANDGRREIDARIKELEAEGEAEKRAATKREQDEKVAQLKSDVEKAKSRRKRMEAEKALNDYLAEIAQKQRDWEREDEIDRLKEQKELIAEETANKKEELKKQYDDKKSAYEKDREEELERIAAEQQQDYENLEAALTAQEELRKSANEKRLEREKAENDARVAAMAEQNEADETALAEHLANLLTQRAESDATMLEQRKLQNEAELQQMAEFAEAEVKQMEADAKLRIEQMEAEDKLRVDELALRNESELTMLKQANEDRLTDEKRAAEDRMLAMKREHEDAETELKEHGTKVKTEVDKTGREVTRKVTSTSKAVVSSTKSTNKQIDDDDRKIHAAMRKRSSETGRALETNAAKTGNTVKSTTQNDTQTLANRLLWFKDQAGSYTTLTAEAIIRNMKSAEGGIKDPVEKGTKDATSAISTGKSDVSHEAQEFVRAMTDPFFDMHGRGSGYGSDLTLGISGGMGDNEWAVRNSADSLAWAQERADMSGDGHTWGADLAINIGNGMYDYSYHVGDAAGFIARVIADNLQHSVPKKGILHEGGRGEAVWGEDLVMNIVDGMRAKEHELTRQTRRMAGIVRGGFADGAGVAAVVPSISSAVSMGVHEALRNGVPQSAGVTVVVKEMHVRKESDIRAVSRGIYALAEDARRRSM